MKITHAMVLAAGLGTRMRPLSEHRPKALVPVLGKALIDWTLDALAASGIEVAVVNTHHHAEELARHLSTRRFPRIEISREEELLDTGGGIFKALPRLGPGPFLRVNADVIWLDGLEPAVQRLAQAWRDERMDALLLCAMAATAHGHDGKGDFLMDGAGKLTYRPQMECAPFVFTSIELLHPRLFATAPGGAFSMHLLWRRAVEQERLYGLRHDGEWFDVGTPSAVAEAERVLKDMGFRKAR